MWFLKRCLVGTVLLLSACFALAQGVDTKGLPPEAAKLVVKLGDKSYKAREGAHQKLLVRMDPGLYEHLKGLNPEDPEINARVLDILKRYEASLTFATYKATKNKYLKGCYKENLCRSVKPVPTNYPFVPWIDMMEDQEDRTHMYSYLEKARKLVGFHCGPHWPDYRTATCLWLDDYVKAKVETILAKAKCDKDVAARVAECRNVLQLKLDKMVQKEDNYWGGKEKNPVRQWWGGK
jgi:hypothetical protein